MLYGLANAPSVFQGIPPLLLHCLHRWYTHLLPEPGQPSPACYAGPSEAPPVPSVPQAGEVRVPSPHCAVPRLLHRSIRDPDGPGEGDSHHGNRQTVIHPFLQELWDTRSYRLWPGPAGYFPCVKVYPSLYTYQIGLQTFVPLLSSKDSSVRGTCSPSFLQRQITISIQLSSF